jgi:hypothetical protein
MALVPADDLLPPLAGHRRLPLAHRNEKRNVIMAANPPGRFQNGSVPIRVTQPSYDAVTAIKQTMEDGKKRQVTYSEVLEIMADAWHRWQALADDVKAAGK